MSGGPNRFNNLGKEKVDFSSLKKLFRYVGKYKFLVIIVILSSILSTMFNVLAPFLLGETTDVIYDSLKELGHVDMASLGQIVLALFIIYILASFFSLIAGLAMNVITQKTIFKLREDLIDKLNKIEVSYFDKMKFGEILSRITNDVETIASSISATITNLVIAITTLVGTLYMMFKIDISLAALITVTVPISLLVILQVVKRSQKYHNANATNLGRVNAHVEEYYNAHDIVKIFNAEEKSTRIFDEINNDLKQSSFKSSFASGFMFPINFLIANLLFTFTVILGAYKALHGMISIGNIQSLLNYGKKVSDPVQTMAEVMTVLQSASAASKRIFEILEEKEIEEEHPTNELKNVKGKVEFRNVKFGYSEDKILMNNINFTVNPGEMCAIVGPTGAGKTTLINLLMRFYDVTEGQILIDDIDITSVTRANLRDKLGMVLQDTWLFNGSIEDNILYGDVTKNHADVVTAANEAYIDHYIRTLSHGYDTILNENATNISAGQKQLLTIARAFISEPDILILDEATSNVDTRTEILIQKAMEKLTKGSTSFVIAHRLSTIRNADKIIVMNHGDIIEVGNHDELIKQDGFYKQLYMSQFDKH